MSVTLELSGGVSLILNAQENFELRSSAHRKDDGGVDYVEWFIEAEGDIVATVPGTVADGLLTRANVVGATNVTVTLKVDGVAKKVWTPGGSMENTPIISDFDTTPNDGAGSSHWNYSLSIYVKEKTSENDEDPNVFDTSTSIMTVKNVFTRVIRKVWRAEAKGKKLKDALKFVLDFRPNSNRVTEELERFFDEKRVVGVWVWDALQDEDFSWIDEDPITKTGGGVDFVEDRQAAEPGAPTKTRPPLQHLARRSARVIRVRGTVRGYVSKKLKPPLPHYVASSKMIRWTAAEESHEVAGPDKFGVYYLPYTEVWINSSDKDPKPNHHGHDSPVFELPPVDGIPAD